MDVIVKDTKVEVPTTPLLRHHQREELKSEVESIDYQLDPSNAFRLKAQADVTEVRNRARRLSKQLQDQSPHDISGQLKDALTRESKAIEDRVLPGMPTQEEMRKNPAGMVGRHMRWEKQHKQDILRWKNIQIMREPDSDDPDLANFERMRPSGTLDRLRTDAQIGGAMNFRSVPLENWNQVFQPPMNTALEQTKRVPEEDKKRKPMTEEQKQVLRNNLALARAKKAELDKAKASDGERHQPVEGESVTYQEA